MASLQKRIKLVISLLNDMIDGGEECRGRDSEITHLIGLLEGNANHVAMEPSIKTRKPDAKLPHCDDCIWQENEWCCTMNCYPCVVERKIFS